MIAKLIPGLAALALAACVSSDPVSSGNGDQPPTEAAPVSTASTCVADGVEHEVGATIPMEGWAGWDDTQEVRLECRAGDPTADWHLIIVDSRTGETVMTCDEPDGSPMVGCRSVSEL